RAGCGRTRLLTELAVDARIFGAHVVHVAAGASSGAHGVADALAQRLFETLPELAQRAAEEHAPALAHLSKAMEQRLGVAPMLMPQVAGEARAYLHEALTAFVAKIAAERLLVVLVDDLERADESSAAWLAALVSSADELKLLVAVGLLEGGDEERSFAIKALRQHARRVAVKPLLAPETHKLLASLFGEVPHLARMSERLFRLTGGVPAQLVELARHLVREGAITNVDGTWVLPQELSEEQLVVDRSDQIKVALARLSDDAKLLGGRLSVRPGALPLELCKAVGELPPRRLFPALEELTREGLLVSTASGYTFDDELVQLSLRALLADDQLKAAHRHLGTFLMAQAPESDLERVSALIHCVEGGDDPAAENQLAASAFRMSRDQPDQAALAAPTLERALKLFRAAGRSDAECVGLLACLAVAGFFSDRRLSTRYADRALTGVGSVL
ncbi:MAG TPA: AAA family ATPase, partial [Polyangiales bacterium]